MFVFDFNFTKSLKTPEARGLQYKREKTKTELEREAFDGEIREKLAKIHFHIYGKNL